MLAVLGLLNWNELAVVTRGDSQAGDVAATARRLPLGTSLSSRNQTQLPPDSALQFWAAEKMARS